jgi:beta-lactamase regulating signal transducer with metallopeptidase domain
MSSLLQHPTAQALAWSLVHFVWQGAAIALTAFAVVRVGRLSASARYITGVVAMAAMLIAPALTFARLSQLPSAGAGATGGRAEARPYETPLGVVASGTPSSLAASARQAPVPSAEFFVAATPSVAPTVILVLWCAGVVVLSLRLMGGWFVARRLARRATSPATPEIQALARKIAGRLALDRIVGVFESSAVSVPVMIGWMKPVVLLPAAALSGLSTGQVEALLAHELAHVRRHDYLVNLLQSVVETLLFYHPAVWWVSSRVRIDRELCCDDVALEVCDRFVYATALSDLAAMTTTPRMALAATDGPLLNRVRRILGQPVDRQDAGSGWLSACLVVLLVGSIAPSALTSPQDLRSAGLQPGVAGVSRSAGLQSGVAGGVQSGVVGGVPGGVASGVVGGVAGGVPAGVAGGVQVPVRQARVPVEVAPEPAQTAEVRRTQAAVARATQIDEERHKIEMERLENEIRHNSDQLQARLAALQADLKLQQQQYERGKQLLEKGLIESIALAELESKLTGTVQAIASEREEANYQQTTLMLKRREIELEREAVVQRRALTAGEVQAEQNRVVDVEKRREAVVKAEQNARGQAADRGVAVMATGVVLSATEPVRAGDILDIVLHGEPDLPKTFSVQTDGTIRFPLVGAIRVLGLTARQVQETLGKQLSERKLAAGSAIDVTLRRPRVPGTGR